MKNTVRGIIRRFVLRTRKPATAAALLACLLTALPSLAVASQRVMLILDASGSMWGRIEKRPKIVIAREAVSRMLEGWDESNEIGLIAYGHRRERDCTDMETLIPVGRLERGRFKRTVEGLNPRGRTPLTATLREAASRLGGGEGRSTVILISDGMESCGADPCAAIRELKDKGVGLVVHAIGFGMEDEKGAAQLRCIARATGGAYLTAENAEGLRAALGRAVEKTTAPEDAALARVPGRACVFLAGQEGGGVTGRGDTLPWVAPVAVKVPDGAVQVHFEVSGRVGNCAGCGGSAEVGPTGEYLRFGIAALSAPINSLIGVFTGDEAAGGSPVVEDAPALSHPFYIHHYEKETVSPVGIPRGAQTLYLGAMDAYGWYNNDGEYEVRYWFDFPGPAGRWKTSEGDMTLKVDGRRVTGPYSQDSGRVLLTATGRHLSGVWVENDSDRTCSREVDKSLHWGRAELDFDPSYRTFTGWWSYCDGAAAFREWTGTRLR